MFVDEADYWLRLEFRVCREFAGMSDKKLRELWCDGFMPNEYSVMGRRPRVTGRVWICRGTRQAEWEFALRLPQRVKSRRDIDWMSLLPPENATCWLFVDEQRQRITIAPGMAVPDVAPR